MTANPRPAPGTTITIVKLRPDGSHGTSYPGMVQPSDAGWIVARAQWSRPRLDLGYLVFEPDDVFVEYFALDQPYNAFALFDPQDRLKGWYCNVTHPTTLQDGILYWHDLYIDVIVYPDGRLLVLDEDELAESRLAESDPALHATILEGRDGLVRLARDGRYPFSERELK